MPGPQEFSYLNVKLQNGLRKVSLNLSHLKSMKKKLATALLLFAAINNLHAQKKDTRFQLKGKLAGQSDGIVYLHYSDMDDKYVRDSSVVTNGDFSFTGSIMTPTRAYVELKGDKINNGGEIYLEPVPMTMRVKVNDFKEVELTGSKTQLELKELQRRKESIFKERQPLADEYTKLNGILIKAVKRKAPEDSITLMKEEVNAFREKFAPFSERINKIDYDFFVKHPNSYVTAYMLRFHGWGLDTMQMFYDKMNETVRQSNYAKYVAKQMAHKRGGSPGSVAKDFLAIDINGNKLTLSGFRGKYVLLDFWASWCVPCRKANPHLKQLYAKYKDKGIEFIGISDDDSKPDAWRKAVEKDGLAWLHVLRGYNMEKSLQKLNESEINERFGVHSLPTKILIDPKGVIIGRYGDDGESDGAMDKTLAEIFNEAKI
jgi:thiol-disulfide isomerase/thioredoxin